MINLDILTKCKLYYSILQIYQNRTNPYQVLYNSLKDELIKRYLKNTYNIR